MMTEQDIKTYLRDLVYTEEEVYTLIASLDLPEKTKTQLLDNVKEKQVIITKLIKFFNPVSQK